MQAVTRRALLSVLPTARRRPLPRLPTRHLRNAARCFHNTPRTLKSDPNDPSKATGTPTDFFTKKAGIHEGSPPRETKGVGPMRNGDSEPGEATLGPEAEEFIPGGNNENSPDRPQRPRGRPIGSKSKRVVSKEMPTPKPDVPLWFLEHGVTLWEDNMVDPVSRKLGISSMNPLSEAGKTKSSESPESEELTPQEEAEMEEAMEEEEKHQYWINDVIWEEIKTHVQAGLILPKTPFLDSFPSLKSNCLLHFPKEGGIYYLDEVVERVASDVCADLVRIDAQDLEEIAGDLLGDSRKLSSSPGFSSRAIRSLGYDAQLASSLSKEVEDTEEENEGGEEEDLDEDEEDIEQENRYTPPPQRPFPVQLIGNLPTPLQQLLLSGRLAGATLIPISPTGDGSTLSGKPHEIIIDNSNEKKVQSLLEALITAAQKKRSAKATPLSTLASVSSEPTKTQRPPTQNRTIVHIRDYRELEETNSGEALIRMLHDIVQRRRKEGESIIILGTTSTEEISENLTKAGIRSIQSQPEDSYERTILIPPHYHNLSGDVFKNDKESRIREVNIRHLRDVIRRRSGDTGQAVTLDIPIGWHLKKGAGEVIIPGIVDTIWNFDRVHRVVTTVLGKRSDKGGKIGIEDIKKAVELLDNSDATKLTWASHERFRRKAIKEFDDWEEEFNSTMTKVNGQWRRTKVKLPKNCTPHEKKLLSGVINPENIHTGFSSVRAADDTIEGLKTLTSMSLIRPEAFKYGVLATDRIPGVLLYGPPGTGKTLLAKAVAKESGATVLEVSGSEIFDMYVGEGEKNVKAIFSLAQKLSPCVVFIDEADAIFGSRHSHSTRTAHREIINQFLKEWADLTTTAFIMVATNRPFDLDDAVLRRLPRRILVDLPTRDDRLEILKIHLSSEDLSSSVSLDSIADQTVLFSGSDLKNVCVSAALACVREENAEAAKANAVGEGYKYREKRLLEDRHFFKALEEISASISDDMSSLTEIRKFDEKYGEKKGKKKRKSNWGFGSGDQRDAQGTGRVREG